MSNKVPIYFDELNGVSFALIIFSSIFEITPCMYFSQSLEILPKKMCHF